MNQILPREIILDVQEYTINERVPLEPRDLLDRIVGIDPSFSMNRILHKKKIKFRDNVRMMSMKYYKLYKILNKDEKINLEYNNRDIDDHRIYTGSNTPIHTVEGIKKHYPELKVITTIDNDAMYITGKKEDVLQAEKEMYLIHIMKHRYLNPMKVTEEGEYANSLYALSDQGHIAYLPWKDKVYREVRKISYPFIEDLDEVLYHIYMVDPQYSLCKQLEKSQEKASFLHTLEKSPMYSLWESIRDIPWMWHWEDSTFTFYTNDTIDLSGYLRVVDVKRQGKFLQIEVDPVEGYLVRQLIQVDLIHDPRNLQLLSDGIIYPQ